MFNLTINAVPASTIIVGRRATWLDRHAAEELVSTYLAQHLGAVVNITCRASPCFLHIFYNTANPIFSE